MKNLIAMTLMTISFTTHANVFCKVNDQVINVLSPNGFECNDEFFMSGKVCFTGSINKTVNILNSKEFEKNFAGTDGEVIRDAKARSKNSISYNFIDLANDYQEEMILKRCSVDFF